MGVLTILCVAAAVSVLFVIPCIKAASMTDRQHDRMFMTINKNET